MIRAFQWDLARQVERLNVLCALLPKYADWGYTELYLHLEDAVEYPSLPTVARADAYTHRQMEQLVEAATDVGIGVVPIVNLLGHTQYLIKTPELRDLNELRASDGSPLPTGQICPLHPKTLEVAEKLLTDVAPFCTTGKVHVGLDESFHLGKCPRCRADVATKGLAGHFAGYVRRLHQLTERRNLRMGMWADMLYFVPEAIEALPRGIIAYDWYYYPFKRHPKVEMYNFAERDLSSAFRSRGIEYWGCPMNGAFRFEPLPIFRDRLENIRSWWKRCKRVGAGGMLITSWEAYRLAFELPATIDAAAASLWRGGDDTDETLLTHGFERVFGVGRKDARRCARAALRSDLYPFAGYAAWETNERWDIRAGAVAESGDATARGAASDTRLRSPNTAGIAERARRLGRLPKQALVAPLSASLRFRTYLERRESFILSAAVRVMRARVKLARDGVRGALLEMQALLAETRGMQVELRAGKQAARQMWIRTRRARQPSQNAAILARDDQRLRDALMWLKTCIKDVDRVWEPNPFWGRWQLCFDVINFAPAVQRVSVEMKESSGDWRELHARHTIEFQAFGAVRRTQIRRPFSCPVESDRSELRLVLRGVGEVFVENLRLTNGVEVQELAMGRGRHRFGRPAPKTGFPDPHQVLEIVKLRGSRADR